MGSHTVRHIWKAVRGRLSPHQLQTALGLGVVATLILLPMLACGVQLRNPTPDTNATAESLARQWATQTAEAQPPTETPEPTPTPASAEVVIPETTNVLSGTTVANLKSISADGSVYTFSAADSQLASLAPGDVIVSGVTDAAPAGFLRKVESVAAEGGQVSVQTSPARLEDAVEAGSVTLSRDLEPTDIRSGWMLPGVKVAAAAPVAAPAKWRVDLDDVVLFDLDGKAGTTNDQIRALGYMEFVPRLDFDLKIAWFKIEKLTLVAGASETVNLKVYGDIQLLDVHKEVQVGYFPLQPIPLAIGPVPIVLTPVLSVNVGLDGTAHVGFTTSVTQQASITAGVKLENGTWNKIADFQHSFDFVPPTVSGNLQVASHGSLQLAVLVYGIGGPYASLSGFFDLDVDIQRTPLWKLGGGLRCKAGVVFDVLGYKANYEANVIDARVAIGQGGAPVTNTPTVTPITPTNTPTNTPKAITPTNTPTPTRTATPTPTATVSPCTIAVDAQLSAAWSRARDGCPTAAAAVIWAAWEPFQHGYMFWRSDNDWTYALHWQGGTNQGAGDWATGGDSWRWDQVSFPDGRGLTPPPGLFEPVRGFGFAWYDKLGGPSSQLGWATDLEKGFCANLQPFERGFIFRSSAVGQCQDASDNWWSPATGLPSLLLSLEQGGTWKKY